MSPQIHSTKDGSSTLYSDQFGQFYHNPNGAATESIHVFFKTPGLTEHLKKAKSLTVLEVGFGTGLNFLLLTDLLKECKVNIPVRFYSIEAFPIDAETSRDFDFTGHIKNQELNSILPNVFDMIKPGMNILKPVDQFDLKLHLFCGSFNEFVPENLQIDYIFHDPFSPEVNGELWTMEAFLKLHSLSKPETVLATYCAASKARGAMCAAGWHVARARGALGKREMTLASLSKEKLKGFKRVNEERLAHRYKIDDFD